MLFTYKAITNTGQETSGTVEAFNVDIAIKQLQNRGLVISKINSSEDKKTGMEFLNSLFTRVSNKDVVILSRQMATLFQAQISALRIFRLLGGQIENPLL